MHTRHPPVRRALSLVSCLHSVVLGPMPISKIRKQRPTEVTCDLAKVAQPVLDFHKLLLPPASGSSPQRPHNSPVPRVSVLPPLITLCSLPSLFPAQQGRWRHTEPTRRALPPYWPIAAVINHNRPDGIKTLKSFFSSSKGQKSNMGFAELKLRYQQSCIPFRRLRRRICSQPFIASTGCPHSLALGHFLHLHSQQQQVMSSSCSICLTTEGKVSTFRDPGMALGSRGSPGFSPYPKVLNVTPSAKCFCHRR